MSVPRVLAFFVCLHHNQVFRGFSYEQMNIGGKVSGGMRGGRGLHITITDTLDAKCTRDWIAVCLYLSLSVSLSSPPTLSFSRHQRQWHQRQWYQRQCTNVWYQRLVPTSMVPTSMVPTSMAPCRQRRWMQREHTPRKVERERERERERDLLGTISIRREEEGGVIQ